MKSIKKASVILRGGLKLEHICCNEIAGVVTVRGTVIYQDTEFRDIPILVLHISRDMGEIIVQEHWYTLRIPRLQAIEDFRHLLRLSIARYLDASLSYTGGGEVLIKGLRQFCEKLRTSRDSTYLVRSLRHAANALNEGSDRDAERARQALCVLLITPPDEVKLIEK